VLPDGSQAFANSRWREHAGLSAEETTCTGWQAIIYPEDVRRHMDKWYAAVKNGEAMESEARVRRVDGEYRWWLIRNVPVRDEGGTIIKWYGTAIDIEDRKRAEEAACRSEQELREVLERMPAIAFSARPDGFNEYQSQKWLEYSGLRLETSKGHGWQAAVHPDDLESHVSKWAAARASGRPFEDEVRHRSASGEYRWHLTRAVPLRDGRGTIVKWCGIATDIEDRKRAEGELKAALAQIKTLKDQLLHENVALREEIDKASMFEEIVGASPALTAVLSRVSKVATTDSTVLITGETGTGKELIARAIHKRSLRSSRAFVAVNLAALPRELIASELFGHQKGAFTGAVQGRIGRFELASGGTIFLDEVGELSPDT